MGIVIRQSIKGTIVNYVGTFVGFLTTFFVLTRFLSAEEIGLTRVLIDASMLFMGLAQLGTSSSIIRYYPYFQDNEKKDHGFFFWTLVVPFVGFLLYSILYLLFKTSISSLFIEKSPLFVEYYYLVLPMAFFMLYQTVFETNSNVLMRIVVPKFVREVLVRVLSLVVYLLLAFNILSLDGFVVCFCAIYAVAAICNIIYLFALKHVSFKPDFKFLTKEMVRDYLLYTFFLIAAALVGAVTPAINTFFISSKMGLSYTGIFAIATYMATLIDIPYRSLGAIAMPQISAEMKDNNVEKTNQLCQQVSLHQFIAASFIFLLIWINIDVIFQILPNGEHYVAGKWVVLLLGLSKIFQSTLSISITALNYSKYYYYSLFFTFILTFTAIVLNNVLIPMLGINGAALATLLSYCAYFLVTLLIIAFTLKILPFSIKQSVVLLIIVILFLLNYTWNALLTPLFLLLPLPELGIALIDAIFKSMTLLSIGIWMLYRWQVSKPLNDLFLMFIGKIGLLK